MDYKDQLRKMKKHRKRYFPVVERLLAIHGETGGDRVRHEITDIDDMVIILELLDLGYLDADSFIVVRSFDDVSRIYYNGRYPLTAAGGGALGF
ncbi:MAG: hypothetical protein JXA20_08375 [Spirochaetes bacterium]|nr:hypothetical protein [Spirochaetota bacterium]